MEQNAPFPASELAATFDALGVEFLTGILEVEVSRHPENLAALCELGHLYTRSKAYEKGLAVDRELVRLRPDDATSHYNLACSLALIGESLAALDALERAVELGYDDAEHLLADEDLATLRGTRRFRAVLSALDPSKWAS